MGECDDKIRRLALLLCVDGVPAFHQKHKGSPTLCIAELKILSLGPHLRSDPDNMLSFAIIPNEMSANKQLKYFDYFCRKELNRLHVHGVPGPDGNVKCKLFGVSLDLKGKEKFWNTIIVGGYCGCSTCQVHFDQGPGGPIYSTARLMLPAHHPLRNANCVFQGYNYVFRNQERRDHPANKTTQYVMALALMAKQRRVEHFLGD